MSDTLAVYCKHWSPWSLACRHCRVGQRCEVFETYDWYVKEAKA